MSQLPLFFHDADFKTGETILLNEETSKHIVQVLRKKMSDPLLLCNGKGQSTEALISIAHKKHCEVQLSQVNQHPPSSVKLHLGVAFTKNNSRNEWILEKATELGVSSIIPLQSKRSERERIKEERWQNILISAMLQSQQYYLPQLFSPSPVADICSLLNNCPQRLLAHCDANFERQVIREAMQNQKDTLILIGPEGDFSPEEIADLYAQDFKGIEICAQRLRTETAAVTVSAYFNLINHA